MVLARRGRGDSASIARAAASPFPFGCLLTFVGVRRAASTWGSAARTALAADTLDGVVGNAIPLLVPGAMGPR